MPIIFFLLLHYLLSSARAQYPPASNLTTIASPVDSNITVSYKTPLQGSCTTAFSTQEQYTGWVHLPGAYPTNTFFWFIASREPSSQLTIWLNGGPGSSSMLGLFTENGPCETFEVAQNQFATRARNWGWDRGSNMLYIDQPNQVGFSYDIPTNGSFDFLTSNLYSPPQSVPSSQPTVTFRNGTFSSLNTNSTANTTQTAAIAVWHMLQGFLGAFPKYLPSNATDPAVSVNLFVESYGGKYGPAFASLWEQQNTRRLNGSLPGNSTLAINLESLGIINGCVDDLVQAPFYPIMANGNSYGLTAINPTRASLANASFYVSGGCKDLIMQCRTAMRVNDPSDLGNVSTVNSLCSNAYTFCTTNVMEPYLDSGRSIYDIGHLLPDPFPPSTYLEYLNTGSFQVGIGSSINFTQTNLQVQSAFSSTGDYERDALIPKLASLLSSGVRIGLIYGDRDYICNWMGGEAVSLAIAASAGTAYQTNFPAAGYAPIIVNASYIGGLVRQYGNLSFSRVYDAGHSVPSYQPETAFQLFARIISRTSVSTGEVIDLSTYNTSGSTIADHSNTLPAPPAATCWLRDVSNTCTDDQKNDLLMNNGVIINGVLYNKASDWPLAGIESSSSIASTAGAPAATLPPTTVSVTMTGFYTATATPTSGEITIEVEVSWMILILNSLASALLLIEGFA
ncbi:MAG: hypothetical protein M1818_001095 [Claussenomyces sp. TS43310]|nr:MAG: hypothetical protein M1818_001095 [Claussenomyces sp. TS43310]